MWEDKSHVRKKADLYVLQAISLPIAPASCLHLFQRPLSPLLVGTWLLSLPYFHLSVLVKNIKTFCLFPPGKDLRLGACKWNNLHVRSEHTRRRWGDDSVCRVPATQAWGPGFSLLKPMWKRPGMWGCTGRQRQDDPWGSRTSQLGESSISRFKERHWLKT